jgi:hypothetical protein
LGDFCGNVQFEKAKDFQLLSRILELHGNVFRHRVMTPLQAIYAFSERKCQNPLDRYYGLQGLLAERYRLEVDYAKSLIEVFLDAVVMIVRSGYSNEEYCKDAIMSLAQAMGIRTN